jgi:hypothetical protein
MVFLYPKTPKYDIIEIEHSLVAMCQFKERKGTRKSVFFVFAR